jgi:cytochrome P450/NADPH-cytochrome P450 reductase
MKSSNQKYKSNIRFMHETADQLVALRKKSGDLRKDLLGIMLSSKDPVTGEQLSDENIRYQLVTFLIAGHETTSGLLSFAIYGLLKNPDTLHKSREEVDRVLGSNPIQIEHLSKLKYLDMVLKETLRLWPTAPGFFLHPLEDTVIGGKYSVKKDNLLIVNNSALHRDTKVWREDVEDFKPERFENFEKLPNNCYKPFGNGQRACIGRPFALQEATIALAMILQRFDLVEADPSYQLKIKQTLTIKPENFFIRARRRTGERTASPQISNLEPTKSKEQMTPALKPLPKRTSIPLLVLYGSNSGSSEAFAQRIAMDGTNQGCTTTVAPLDDYVHRLPTEGAVIIATGKHKSFLPSFFLHTLHSFL